MRILIETETNQDPMLFDICITDESDFSIDITFRSQDAAVQFKRYMTGFKGIYQMDAPPLNFKINYNNDKVVKFNGNINNALKIIIEERLLSQHLIVNLKNNPQIQELLKRCNAYYLDFAAKSLSVNCDESKRMKEQNSQTSLSSSSEPKRQKSSS